MLLASAGPARAQSAPQPAAPAAAVPPAAAAWLWHAFASVSAVDNLNDPSSGKNAFRVFDFDEHPVRLDVLELTAARTTVRTGDIGFRVDLDAGQAIPRVSAASGLVGFLEPAKAHDVDVKQAYASVALRGNVRVDVGKFVTPLGFEAIEGWDAPNDNASRSLLFGYAIPFTHTGVRMTASGAHVSWLVAVVNGWDVIKDNNRGKTVAAQITLTPSNGLSVSIGGITGPEQPHDAHDLRTVFDVVATYRISDLTTVGFNADDGYEANAALGGGPARWRGSAGYARVGLTPKVALCLRGEVFDDPGGARTGVAQRLEEATVTPEVRLSSHLITRMDLRIDRSTSRVFDARHGAARTQPTIEANLLFVF